MPEGYFVFQSQTFGNLLFWRGFLVNGDPQPAVENFKKRARIYPLAAVATPPEQTFVKLSGKAFNTIHANNAQFFEEINAVVQEEPSDAIDAETLGLLAAKMVGVGSQYAGNVPDAQGHYLDGGKTYPLHLPPNIPAKNFWSLLVYDPQTRSELQTDQPFPSVSSQTGTVKANADGSYDVYFGPDAPAGHETNWIQTVPGKGWFVVLRLYGPLEPWFDKSWRPGDIELVP